jgi:hypothetical protein
MLMAAFTATYVIQAPVNTIQSFIEARSQQATTVQMPSLKHEKAFLKICNRLVMDMQAEAMKLTSEEASSIWKSIQKDMQPFSKMDKAIRNMVPIYVGEKELILIIKSLWLNINQLTQDIKLIAQLPEVDETTAAYADYFGDMLQNAIQDPSNTRVMGKKALLYLFED